MRRKDDMVYWIDVVSKEQAQMGFFFEKRLF
jgi:hypothetical protein